MFDDLDDYDDDFEESGASKQNDEFNANELLNFSGYQNKREAEQKSKAPPAVAKKEPAKKVEESGEDWGDEWDQSAQSQDLNNFDYKKSNLNKLD